MVGVGSSLDDINAKGAFKRIPSSFRNWIKKGGEFEPEAGRYHLYVSYACPWAHRTLITRKLKGLDDVIGVTVVHYFMGEKGWTFGLQPEPFYGLERIKDIYMKANSDYSGRFTVPVLWDKKTETIVNNESSEIIVMLNDQFNDFATKPEVDLLPDAQAGADHSANAESASRSGAPVKRNRSRIGFHRPRARAAATT